MSAPVSPPRSIAPGSRQPSVSMAAHNYVSTPVESAVQKVKRHPKYYLNGGDVHFLVENYLFRVHRYFFERESAHFREQLAIPAPAGQSPKGSSDANPFLLDDVAANDFARFLWVFYNPKYSIYDATVEDWSAILKLSYDWRFGEVQKLCCRELEKFNIEPLAKIELYQTYDLDKKLLVPSYIALCARPEPLTIREGRQLGLETALLLATARECARGILTESGARSPAPASLEAEDMTNIIKDVFGLSPGPPSPDLTPSEPLTGTGLSTFIGTISPVIRLTPLSAANAVDAALSAAAGSTFTGAYAAKSPFQTFSGAMHSASTTAVQSVFGGDTAVPSPTVSAAATVNGTAPTPAANGAAATAAAAAASSPVVSKAANGANGNAPSTGAKDAAAAKDTTAKDTAAATAAAKDSAAGAGKGATGAASGEPVKSPAGDSKPGSAVPGTPVATTAKESNAASTDAAGDSGGKPGKDGESKSGADAGSGDKPKDGLPDLGKGDDADGTETGDEGGWGWPGGPKKGRKNKNASGGGNNNKKGGK